VRKIVPENAGYPVGFCRVRNPWKIVNFDEMPFILENG
jgi:hypothetical protein